jgi:hypothetical protein
MSGVRDPLPDPRARTSSAWLPLQSSRTGLGSRTLLSWARSNLIPTDVRLRRPLPGASFRRSLRADGATRLPRSAFAVSHCLDGFLHLRVAGLLRPAAGRMFAAFCRRPPPGGIAPFGSGRRRLATRTPFEELSSSTAAPRHRGPCLPAVTFRPDEYRSGEAFRPLAPGPRERLGAIGLSAGSPCWESACAVLLRSLSRAGVLASSGVAAFGVGSGPARLTPIDRLRCAAVTSPCGGDPFALGRRIRSIGAGRHPKPCAALFSGSSTGAGRTPLGAVQGGRANPGGDWLRSGPGVGGVRDRARDGSGPTRRPRCSGWAGRLA